MSAQQEENLSDSDSSEATIESNEWPDEKDFEMAVFLDQKYKIRLPKELCENHEIFNELFSMSTWNQLTVQEKSRLSSFLPSNFPENHDQERQNTIEQLFNNEISRFGETPVNKFFNNLQDGNYRPDIAHYRKQILRAEKRDQMLAECERISVLAEQLILSRDKMLKSAYKRPVDTSTPSQKFRKSVALTGSTVRANKRYIQELLKISNEYNYSLSDEEDVDQFDVLNEHVVIFIN